ncbi:MAG: FAD-binding oxidoreductase, partial [Proteobacteria bacterium]|nr:FAD-binding oxidoreductase [Pseudomonadota bacterium]
RRPDFVVFAETAEEVQKLLRLANETVTPVIPYSSGLNFHGATIPDHGGVILNLSRMNSILSVDEQNWFAVIEPGVTYERLQDEALRRGFRIMIPLGAAPKRSVLSSYLERDPALSAASFEYGNFLIMDMEMVLPDGEIFRTGQWASGGEPGGPMGPVRNSLFRLWTGAQGTLGIITKMGVQITPFIKEREIYFIAFNELAEAIEPLQAIQKREIGLECFLLNRFNLAALLSEEWQIPETFPAQPTPSESFDSLRKTLPRWVMVICINGGLRQPQKKIAYEAEALREACCRCNVELMGSLPGGDGLSKVLLDEIIRPWGILKKFNYRGSVHALNFKSPVRQIARMEEVIKKVCAAVGYDAACIGGYVLPLERGRAMHCEFDLHCSLDDIRETMMVKDAWLRASERLMGAGAFFDRPYGAWADMLYKRCGMYTQKLREIKKELDPNNILNPGKLCFP